MTDIHTLLATPTVQSLLQATAAELDKVIDLSIAIQQIPAPTFAEHTRATFVQQQFEAMHLLDVRQDAMGNVFGRYPGRQSGAPVVVSAHSDTVFPLDTDLTVRRESNRIHGPGIADNSAGVGGLLQLIALFTRFAIKPQRDIWFVVNVAEEGLGDLAGMREVVNTIENAHAYIVLEGGMYGYILHEAIGVRRYRVRVTTQGGHSWSDFGRPSAIHILSHIISSIDNIDVPDRPKTTYNIGVINGGTSINTIAATADFLLDLRSEETAGLDYLIERFQTIISRAQLKFDATIASEIIGNRPSGKIGRDTPLITHAAQALHAVGCPRIHYMRGSTDANIPLSLGIPAVCIGLGKSANAHRLDEYLDTKNFVQGMQQLALLTLLTADYS